MLVCPSHVELDRYLARELSADQEARLRNHLESCSSCAQAAAAAEQAHEELIGVIRRLPPPVAVAYAASDSPDGLPPVSRSDHQIPGYQLLREVHHGGQGVVYEAIQHATQRKVAIKIMAGRGSLARERARIDREIRVLAQLRHPGIVTIHDGGVCRAGTYLVMDWIDGSRLDDYLHNTTLTIRQSVKLVMAICEAVNAAHRLGILHRDLKPANILVDRAGQPRLLDFGLAKRVRPDSTDSHLTLTQPGQFVGTLLWSSPEQVQDDGRVPDLRADVYAIGVILYQALTGRFPYPVDRGVRETIENICCREPVRPSRIRADLGGDVETLILKCLAKDPDARYQTAGAVAADLANWLEGRPIAARANSSMYVLRKTLWQHKAITLTSAVALCSLLAAVIGMSWQAARLAHQRDVAIQAEERAEAQAARADAEAERLRRSLYLQRIALARHACDVNQADEVRRFLELCPPDLRGWEWGRLALLSDQSVERLSPGTSEWPRPRDLWINCRSGRHEIPAVSRTSQQYAIAHHKTLFIRRLADAHTLQQFDQEHGIYEMAFSPQSDRLAWLEWTGDDYMFLKIWHIRGCHFIAGKEQPQGELRSLDWSPDGHLITCIGSDVVFWDPDRLTVTRRIRVPGGEAIWARFSPDGRELAVASVDAAIRIFPVDAPEQIRVLRGHTEVCRALAWSTNGRRLASGGGDRTLRIWDTDTGQCLYALRGHTRTIIGIGYMDDGRWASLCEDGQIRIWQPARPHDRLSWMLPGSSGVGSFSPDGSTMAIPTGWEVRLYDASRSSAPLKRWDVYSVGDYTHVAQYAPDGTCLLTAGSLPELHIWDLEGRKQRVLEGHTQGVPAAFWSPNGRECFSASWDGSCRAWDAVTGEGRLLWQHSDELWDMTVSPDGQQVAVAGKDGTVAVIHRDGTLQWSAKAHTDAVDALAWDPQNRWVVSAGWDGAVKLFTPSGELVHTFRSGGERLYSAVFTSDGRRLLLGGHRRIEVWDPISAEMVYSFEAHPGSIYMLALSPDGQRLISGGSGEMVHLWPILSELP